MTEERDDVSGFDEHPMPVDADRVDTHVHAGTRIDLYGGPNGSALNGTDRHRFHRIISTAIFDRTSRRLGNPQRADAMYGLTDDSVVDRIKTALYDRTDVASDPTVRRFLRKEAPSQPKLLLLERVARSLGDDWCDDSRSFWAVTMAMGRLQVLLRKTVAAAPRPADGSETGHALLTFPAGEDHHFGHCVLDEMFRSRGWVTRMLQQETPSDLSGHLARHRYDLVCLSWSTGALGPMAAAAISAVDAMPAVERPAIIAGGGASTGNRQWMVRLGVDHVCDTAYGAIGTAESLLADRRVLTEVPDRELKKEPNERAG